MKSFIFSPYSENRQIIFNVDSLILHVLLFFIKQVVKDYKNIVDGAKFSLEKSILSDLNK